MGCSIACILVAKCPWLATSFKINITLVAAADVFAEVQLKIFSQSI
jgi:hypothetical protein